MIITQHFTWHFLPADYSGLFKWSFFVQQNNKAERPEKQTVIAPDYPTAKRFMAMHMFSVFAGKVPV
ncbi:hypothetical protein QE177_01640 [Arsenophonus sp. aPb]|uniref:hypothetical protein n=1 Tax=Arsenophonus sp. aPb TaxID=3041619 RepID=UPI002468933C|nr:hypothetical protein [Arsenophonus sp. aPb]WGL98637.1 hypothetical protein QE177_01640 [Arsenophonus sp. aPb]